MLEKLSFSVIGELNPELQQLLMEFEQTNHIQLELVHMTWEDAWARLLSYALQGGGPDISHVGSTWVSSLVTMNTLREFSSREVEAIGGAQVFTAPAWQSATLQNDPRIWSIPWSSFTFLVLYRRDHLKTSGIDESRAFETPEALAETVNKLQAGGYRSPILLPSGSPFLDRVHIAASWVWAAGGTYFSDDGKQSLLNTPQTRGGLKSFFELYRLMSPDDLGLGYEDVLVRFSGGESSVVIADCGYPAMLAQEKPQHGEVTGIHSLPGVPFVSGDNLVIWQATRQFPEKERLALKLVSFLVSRSSQSRLSQSLEQFPVRHDALETLDCEVKQLMPTLKKTFETGRAHRPIHLWTRYERDLGHTFDEITKDVLARRSLPVASILEIHLSQLHHRFSLLMG